MPGLIQDRTIGSDDYASDENFEQMVQATMERSRLDGHWTNGAGPSNAAEPGPSNLTKEYESQLQADLDRINHELDEMDERKRQLERKRDSTATKLREYRARVAVELEQAQERGLPTVNYTDDFEWTPALKATMRRIFNIQDFRLCQKGVCNASMDERDIICVMPTGGGKSLTYQLPAIMAHGCTIVISPLISLMADQVHHMQEAGVEAVMIMSTTTRDEKNDIYRRFDGMIAGRGNEIKLCYVTPERLAKDKGFVAKMQKLYEAKKLTRAVIDEAHCISSMGHDYRPDYQQLSMLRQWFPKMPIQALSATCPPRVQDDIIKILKLRPMVDGTAARPNRTVFFSSPLYRKNLHYKVLQKPSAKAAVFKAISDWILSNHPKDSGIVYCLTVKDTEDVAAGIRDESGGKIKTGVYHAKVDDARRMRLHEQWRDGAVQVVCATIAFGLGIDKGNVRFVIHHSMSKSLDGFYQESGRAGRDGLDADCVLYYRHQDAIRIREVTCTEQGSGAKLHEMARFALDLKQCRKIHFAKYFSMSANLRVSAWSTEDEDAEAPCRHCDNCTRAPETVEERDVTLDAWKILRVAEYVRTHRGRVTLNQLADLARGAGKGEFNLAHASKSGPGKASVNLEELCGEPVNLSKEYTETLTMRLYLDGYFEEVIQQTAYSVNIYLKARAAARDLTRYSSDEIEGGKGPRVVCTFLCKSKRANGKQPKDSSKISDSESEETPARRKPASKRKAPAPKPASRKGKKVVRDSDDDKEEDFTQELREQDAMLESQDDDDDYEDWQGTLRPESKRARTSTRKASARSGNSFEEDVIEISSD